MSLRSLLFIFLLLLLGLRVAGQRVDGSDMIDDAARERAEGKRQYMDAGGPGSGFAYSVSDYFYLNGCPDQFISLSDAVTLYVETNGTDISWFSNGIQIGSGVTLTVSPSQSSLYKAVVSRRGVLDSCFVRVYVRDAFSGGASDGFTRSAFENYYLLGCPDQYISRSDAASLHVISNVDSVKWYNGDTYLGKGKDFSVSPLVTTTYKILAEQGRFRDSSYVTIHVRDDYSGGSSDGFSVSEKVFYLRGCADQFIAVADSAVLDLETNGTDILWYQNNSNIGTGDKLIVRPSVTTTYKAVVKEGDLADTCLVTVHVRKEYQGDASDGFASTSDPTFLKSSGEVYIALHESTVIKVWSHTNDVKWYDSHGNYIETGKMATVSPLEKTIYKAVVKEGDFADSCYVTVHVNDNYGGAYGDGFAPSPFVPYLRGCSDRFIAMHESASLYADSYTDSLKWYDAAGRYLGDGDMLSVIPDSTSIFKIVGYGKNFLDSCYVTVHVNDNYGGNYADGFTKSCEVPDILDIKGIVGHPCAGAAEQFLKVIVFGNDLEYYWQKYDTVSRKFTPMPEALKPGLMGLATAKLEFRSLTTAYDGLYRCLVKNQCDSVISDTIPVHVNRCAINIELTPDSVLMCRNTRFPVLVELLDGTTPWSYKYLSPSGRTEISSGLVYDRIDTLWVTDAGDYQFTYLTDESGDVRIGAENLPKVYVEYHREGSVELSGNQTVCWGDDALLQLHPLGTGPWQVWINRSSDDSLATEIRESWPLTITGDTILRFTGTEENIYILSHVQDLYNNTAVCDGLALGSASVRLDGMDVVRFRPLADNHIGQCSSIDLYDLLGPEVNGILQDASAGTFYIDSVALAGNQWDVTVARSGSHKIYYQLNGVSCGGRSSEVTLYIDSLWIDVSLSKRDVCVGEQLNCFFKSGGMGYTVAWDNIRVARGGVVTRNSKTQTMRDSTYSLPVSWLNDEVSQVIHVTHIADRHGCNLVPDTKDTVDNHARPSLGLQTRSASTGWSESNTVNIREGESAHIRGQLNAGMAPWTLWGKQIEPAGGNFGIHTDNAYADTTLKKEALYCFQVEDKYCANWMDEKCVFVKYVRPAYVRLKVLLEGPYDNNSARMTSSLQDVMPRYFGMDRLPVENGAIDWIEIELRQGKSGTTPISQIAEMSDNCNVLLRDTCLLLADGTVVDRNGNTKIEFSQNLRQSEDCYIVLHHRNHLAVMTGRPYRITTSIDSAVFVDFTDSSTVYTGTENLSQTMSVVGVRDGKQVWALGVGEVNENAIVSLLDPNDVKAMGLRTTRDCGYNILDVNFDGKVNWPGLNDAGVLPDDWIRSRMNRDKHTNVRFKDNR